MSLQYGEVIRTYCPTDTYVIIDRLRDLVPAMPAQGSDMFKYKKLVR